MQTQQKVCFPGTFSNPLDFFVTPSSPLLHQDKSKLLYLHFFGTYDRVGIVPASAVVPFLLGAHCGLHRPRLAQKNKEMYFQKTMYEVITYLKDGERSAHRAGVGLVTVGVQSLQA